MYGVSYRYQFERREQCGGGIFAKTATEEPSFPISATERRRIFGVRNMVKVHICSGSAPATIWISDRSDHRLRKEEGSLTSQRSVIESSTPGLIGEYLLGPIEKNNIWSQALELIFLIWSNVVDTSSSSGIFHWVMWWKFVEPSLVLASSSTVLYVSVIKISIVDMINRSIQCSFLDVNFVSISSGVNSR